MLELYAAPATMVHHWWRARFFQSGTLAWRREAMCQSDACQVGRLSACVLPGTDARRMGQRVRLGKPHIEVAQALAVRDELRGVGMAQSQNSSVYYTEHATSFHGLATDGNVMLGNKAFEFYNERNPEDYIQIPASSFSSKTARLGSHFPRATTRRRCAPCASTCQRIVCCAL